MDVVVIPDHRAPVVTHMVWYKVGGGDDAPGKSGLAHFLEHLLFKGTKDVPSGDFSRIVARNGGNHNAFTNKDLTGYYENVAVDRLELVMKMEADRMVNLQLSEEVVGPELEVVREERRMRVENSPSGLFNEQMMAAFYLSHPYGIPVIGWDHELKTLTHGDALDFYRRYYAPNNAILVVAGDVTVAQVRGLAETYYGPLPRGPAIHRRWPVEPPHRAARRLSMTDARVTEPTWSRMYLAPTYTAGKTELAHALVVLSDVLGGGPTSRLYQALVVERKIAAGAGAWYDAGSRAQSAFGLYGVPMAGGDPKAVEAAADAILAQFLESGAMVEEVERAKGKLIAQAVYARDSVSGMANIYGSALAVGLGVEDVEGWPELIRAVTVEDVNRAARQVLVLESSTTGFLLPEPKS